MKEEPAQASIGLDLPPGLSLADMSPAQKKARTILSQSYVMRTGFGLGEQNYGNVTKVECPKSIFQSLKSSPWEHHPLQSDPEVLEERQSGS